MTSEFATGYLIALRTSGGCWIDKQDFHTSKHRRKSISRTAGRRLKKHFWFVIYRILVFPVSFLWRTGYGFILLYAIDAISTEDLRLTASS